MFRWFRRIWRRLTGQGGRLLVVDASADAVRLLRTHLQPAGLTINVVANPQTALHFVRNVESPPHAVIISLRQDAALVGAVEAAVRLLSERAVSRSPVLVLHDPLGEEFLARCRHMLPRAEFIERPYQGAFVRRRVRQAVRLGQRRPLARSSIRHSAMGIPPQPRLRTRR